MNSVLWLENSMRWLSKLFRHTPRSKDNPVLRLRQKPSDPLILDRYVDVAYALLWFSYGLWGVTTLVLGLPTITQFTPDWYQTAWSGAIGLLSITASIVTTLLFFETRWMSQLTKKVLERAIVFVLCPFLGIYPFLLILRSLDGEAYKTAGLAVLILSFLIFPVLRLHILKKRIKALEEVLSNATGANRVL